MPIAAVGYLWPRLAWLARPLPADAPLWRAVSATRAISLARNGAPSATRAAMHRGAPAAGLCRPGPRRRMRQCWGASGTRHRLNTLMGRVEVI